MDTTTENEPLNLPVFSIGKYEISIERFRAIINYDPDSGLFFNKDNQIVGTLDDDTGYIRLRIWGFTYRAHMLAWFLTYEKWTRVDHKDRIKNNNRLDNLREATQAQNCYNQGVRYTNMLGIKGVQKRGNKYRAYITFNYKTIHLGTFASIEDAIIARQDAADFYFGEFSNG